LYNAERTEDGKYSTGPIMLWFTVQTVGYTSALGLWMEQDLLLYVASCI